MRTTKFRHSVIPRRIGKSGVIVCSHCDLVCEHEVFTDTHRFLGENVDTLLEFCSPECKATHHWDDIIVEEVERRLAGVEQRIEEEIRWFHAHGICPHCKKRILERLHNCK